MLSSYLASIPLNTGDFTATSSDWGSGAAPVSSPGDLRLIGGATGFQVNLGVRNYRASSNLANQLRWPGGRPRGERARPIWLHRRRLPESSRYPTSCKRAM